MPTWSDVAAVAPELASAVRRQLDAHRHTTLATLRADGSPRISGIEAMFHGDDLWLGMMDGSRKAHDLRRDPRFALHSATVDPEMAGGDAKIAGRAIEVTDPATVDSFVRDFADARGDEPPSPFHLFRVDVREIVLTRVGDPPDHLVIESWRDGAGLRRVQRA